MPLQYGTTSQLLRARQACWCSWTGGWGEEEAVSLQYESTSQLQMGQAACSAGTLVVLDRWGGAHVGGSMPVSKKALFSCRWAGNLWARLSSMVGEGCRQARWSSWTGRWVNGMIGMI